MSDESRKRRIRGIHHVTAICGSPQENLDFYTGVLGQRFVKNTVNFGDPTSYHLYYGDEVGQPGTIMTFFAWPGANPGHEGAGVPLATSYSVPEASLEAWSEVLEAEGLEVEEPHVRFGDPVLPFRDPHGLRVELVGDVADDSEPDWRAGPVEAERATRGFHGMTLPVTEPDATAELLTDVFDYRAEGEADEPGGQRAGRRHRFRARSTGKGAVIDLVRQGRHARSAMGVGVVHHIAFRAEDADEQAAWGEELRGRGLEVTPVRDRQYFQSIYFREPSGVLFEIATDPPGFTVDESVEELGSNFKLPPWLEPDRARIVSALPDLDVREHSGGTPNEESR